MSPALLIITALIYAAVAIDMAQIGRPWMGLAFFAYGVANLGIMMDGRNS
jgi:hypothetical protein